MSLTRNVNGYLQRKWDGGGGIIGLLLEKVNKKNCQTEIKKKKKIILKNKMVLWQLKRYFPIIFFKLWWMESNKKSMTLVESEKLSLPSLKKWLRRRRHNDLSSLYYNIQHVTQDHFCLLLFFWHNSHRNEICFVFYFYHG